MKMLMVVGLGNPGPDYRQTRHNAGFMLVDALASKLRASWQTSRQGKAETATASLRGRRCLLVKPMTFMNGSGEAVGPIARFHRIPAADVILVYDEYTLPLGKLKITLRGGDGGHNGVGSVRQHLGKGFVRYRIGIGVPDKPKAMSMTDFVLGKFSPAEETAFNEAMPALLDGLTMVVTEGAERAMNHLNQRSKKRDANDSDAKIQGDVHPGHAQLRTTGGDSGGTPQGGDQLSGRDGVGGQEPRAD